MKTFKKLGFALFICMLTLSFSENAYGAIKQQKKPRRVIATPLDGGLLTVLGAAGVGYYLIRKKKKDSAGI